MVVLQVLGLVVGIISAFVGFSNSFFLLINPKLVKRQLAYNKLMAANELTDRHAIHDLLKFTRAGLVQLAEDPEFSKYGMMRNWREVTKLVVVPGKIDQREAESFAVMHPIYGYNDRGELRLGAGLREFHYLYSEQVRSLQQSQAFFVLLVSFIIQFFGIFLP